MKQELKCKLLKSLRAEAKQNLSFRGMVCGYWSTTVRKVRYRSEVVSAYQFVDGQYQVFLRNAILDRVFLMRNKHIEKQEIKDLKADNCLSRLALATEYKHKL